MFHRTIALYYSYHTEELQHITNAAQAVYVSTYTMTSMIPSISCNPRPSNHLPTRPPQPTHPHTPTHTLHRPEQLQYPQQTMSLTASGHVHTTNPPTSAPNDKRPQPPRDPGLRTSARTARERSTPTSCVHESRFNRKRRGARPQLKPWNH